MMLKGETEAPFNAEHVLVLVANSWP